MGPFTWALTADQLRKRGASVVVPTLKSSPSNTIPYWQQHAEAVRASLSALAETTPVILIAHSGAGPLLPAIRYALPHPVAGYIFVDAGWPEDGKSRLDLFEDQAAADAFRQSAENGMIPAWTEEDLREVIPDNTIRNRFVRELRPLPLGVYEEALPLSPGWPDAPCALLRFGDNPAYERTSVQAERSGCQSMRLEGEHFHMLVEPEAVADALAALAARMGQQQQD